MFDVPDTNPIEVEPVTTAHKLIVNFNDTDPSLPITVTPDMSLVSGGTTAMIRTGDAGGLPHPWSGPVTHADRVLGATRGAVTYLRDGGPVS